MDFKSGNLETRQKISYMYGSFELYWQWHIEHWGMGSFSTNPFAVFKYSWKWYKSWPLNHNKKSVSRGLSAKGKKLKF